MRAVDSESLRGFVPFHVFDDLRLQALASQSERLFVRKDQILASPGIRLDHALFLLAGHVRMEQSGEIITPCYRYALNTRILSQDTVVALTDCSLIRVDKVLLDKLVCWAQAIRYLEDDIACQHQYDRESAWMRLILKSNLFYKVPPLNIHRVFAHLVPKPVSKGEVILTQGEVGDGCYFIKQGSAIVTRQVVEKPDPVILAEIGVGRCFGEDALVHETVRNATITMLTDGLLMKMEKRDFVQLLKEPPVDILSSVDLDIAINAGAILVDVRSPAEFELSHLKNAINMPLDKLRLMSKLLDNSSSHVVYCDTDRRSKAAAFLLDQQGFRARALAGGLNSMDPALKQTLVVST